MYAIVTLPLVPIRREHMESSEMLSQLLFGECVEILSEQANWLYIRNMVDNYTGWADKKMLSLLSEEEYLEMLRSKQAFRISTALSVCVQSSTHKKTHLPAASVMRLDQERRCIVKGENYAYNAADLSECSCQSGEQVLRYAHLFLNAPYLWGGKSILGIDCSGLVQVVFSMAGFCLPRDAWQQAQEGQLVKSIDRAQAGDLAFFSKDKNRVSHVGILINNRQILHASGWVKIESIDSEGILPDGEHSYSHKLHSIRRILPDVSM